MSSEDDYAQRIGILGLLSKPDEQLTGISRKDLDAEAKAVCFRTMNEANDLYHQAGQIIEAYVKSKEAGWLEVRNKLSNLKALFAKDDWQSAFNYESKVDIRLLVRRNILTLQNFGEGITTVVALGHVNPFYKIRDYRQLFTDKPFVCLNGPMPLEEVAHFIGEEPYRFDYLNPDYFNNQLVKFGILKKFQPS